MGGGFLNLAGIVAVGVVVAVVLLAWMERKNIRGKERLRRGAGHVMLGFQEFIEPSVEYIFQAQNVEQKEEEDDDGLGISEEQVRSGLAEAMARSPIDHEEVRSQLTAASRLGLNWNAIFASAVANELRERPYRAPSIPPVSRVAPREK